MHMVPSLLWCVVSGFVLCFVAAAVKTLKAKLTLLRFSAEAERRALMVPVAGDWCSFWTVRNIF